MEKGLTGDPPDLDADCILLLSTSAGAQMVVATVPAMSEASMCVRTSSSRLVRARIIFFAAVYGAICPTSGHESR